MSRVYHVTLTKEIQLNVIAESKEEALRALEDDDGIDEWADTREWSVNVMDPVYFWNKMPSTIPEKFKEPDGGVLDGAHVAFWDCVKEHPDWHEKLLADVNEVRLSLVSSGTVLKK